MIPVFISPEGELLSSRKPEPTPSSDVEELSPMKLITRQAEAEATKQSTNKANK